MTGSITVRPAAPLTVLDAVRLLHVETPREEQAVAVATLLDEIRRDDHLAELLFEARNDGVLVGVTFAHVMPGAAASIWAPALVLGAEPWVAKLLLNRLHEKLGQLGCVWLQALVDSRQVRGIEALAVFGYAKIASLSYLVWSPQAAPASDNSGVLELVSYEPRDYERLASIVERTYIDTLDCAPIEGKRNVAQILEGYRNTGESGTKNWWLARSNGQDVGCLLLATHDQGLRLEIVYLGLSPEGRGQKWGDNLLSHAQKQAETLHVSLLVTAVDEANLPAMKLYARHGFELLTRREVWGTSLAKPSLP